MKYLSLFSGIGGFELGINQAYVEATTRKENGGGQNIKAQDDEARQGLDTSQSETARAENGRPSKHSNIIEELRQPTCVGYSEIDKYAIQVYEKHFNHKNYGDITKIKATELPDFDLLVGGFPCQAFSIAGKRLGLEDTRGTLFYDIARIAKEKRPKHLLLENVKGLLSHDNGRTFKTIITTFADLGYDLEWQVLNSKNFGVPQNRERVFIIGYLRGVPKQQIFPITRANPKDIRQVNNARHDYDRIYETSGIAPTINTGQRGNAQPKIIDRPFVQNPKMRDYKKNYDNTGTITASTYKEPPVINSIRRLTPVECERLQAYPDNWTNILSDSQRYKTLGNGVTTKVVQEIIKQLYYQ